MQGNAHVHLQTQNLLQLCSLADKRILAPCGFSTYVYLSLYHHQLSQSCWDQTLPSILMQQVGFDPGSHAKMDPSLCIFWCSQGSA